MAGFAPTTNAFPPSWSPNSPRLNYFRQMLTSNGDAFAIGAAIRELSAHVKQHCPNALILYNEYGAYLRPSREGEAAAVDSKRSQMLSTLDVVNAGADTRGYIDGVGFESHFGCEHIADWSANGLRAVRDDIVSNLAAFVARGLSTHISEIDWTNCLGNDDRWKVMSHMQFSACFNQPRCSTIGIWGVADPFRWQQPVGGSVLDHHTLFDSSGRPHPSYFGLVDALLGRKPIECASSQSREMQAYCSLPVLPIRQAVGGSWGHTA